MVFDYNYYISNNGDIKAAFGNDLKSYYMHYMTNGSVWKKFVFILSALH